MKKLVLRVHTQRVLLKGLYHKASMGFKWQTLTKVFHGKPPCFVNSYKVAPIYIRTKRIGLDFKIYDKKCKKQMQRRFFTKRALAFVGKITMRL